MSRKVKTKKDGSKGFISLRDFLLIGRFDNESVIDELNTGPEWIKLYETAKKQYKLYGNEPPLNSHVITIRSGLGGPVGLVKKITGTESYGDKEYFVLDRGEEDSYQENLSYLIDKNTWWAYFMVVPVVEQQRQSEKEELEDIL